MRKHLAVLLALFSLVLILPSMSSAACTDSDGGVNPYIAGTCDGVNDAKDRCVAGRFLLEQSCRLNRFCIPSIINCNQKCQQDFGVPGACSANACKCQQPVSSAEILISEVDRSFVELTIRDDKDSNLDVSGWSITTFDGGDNFVLPAISDFGEFDYLSVHFGPGTNDLNASDGSATVYFNVPSPIRAAGDEVGLLDSNGNVVDFVRFNGGNGDPVLAGWSASDPGPTLVAGKSVQIHGPDMNSSENWVTDIKTEAEPNVLSILIGHDVDVELQNGVNREIFINDSKFGSVGFDVVNTSAAVNLSELRIIEEMMNFSLNFYRGKGFNDPRTNSTGKIKVTVSENNKFNAAAKSDGTMKVDIGGDLTNLTIASFIKWNVEHEFYHLIEYERFHANGAPDQNGPFDRDPVTSSGGFAFWDEGASEYWGFEISKKQYNVSDSFLFNASVQIKNNYSSTFKSIPYNFSEILEDFDFDLTSFTTGSGKKVYTHGYLFAKYVADTYGDQKLVHIHNITRNNKTGGGNEVLGKDAIEKAFKEEGINKTFEDIWVEWRRWIFDTYGTQIKFTEDHVFNSSTVSTGAESLEPWGTDYERFNITSAGSFIINFTGGPEKYDITVVKILRDGSRQTENRTFSRNIVINVTGNVSQIILIKTQLGGSASTYTVRIQSVPADVRLSQTLTAVNVTEGERTNITVNKTLRNEGPAELVEVTVTKTASAPPGCTIVPSGHTFRKNLTKGTNVNEIEIFTINCTQPGSYTFTVNNTVTNSSNPDTNVSNNAVSTNVTVNVTSKPADARIVNQSFVDAPVIMTAGQARNVTLNKTLRNDGPAETVEVEVTKSVVAPPGCTVVPAGHTFRKNLTRGQTVSEVEVFLINCTQPGNHVFTFNNTITNSSRPDNDTSNNAMSTQLTVPVVAVNATNATRTGVDTDTTGNSATFLGTIENCISVQNGAIFDIDVFVDSIPPGRDLIGFGYTINSDPSVVNVAGQNHNFLLGSQLPFSPIYTGDSVPDADGSHVVNIVDLGGVEPSGSKGVLGRYAMRATGPGLSNVLLLNTAFIDSLSNAYVTDTVSSAIIAVDRPCPVCGDGIIEGTETCDPPEPVVVNLLEICPVENPDCVPQCHTVCDEFCHTQQVCNIVVI